ncbi:MAG: putative Uracil-DNA glycosylase superfamily, partial [Chloroflexi bacterium]|nr:putative Uracil-DNA glycosylase superfamily [Chloroflexota bacterium]
IRMHTCRLCLDAGYDIYPRAIFSGGIGARILLIGQAPGITEKEAGRPFNAGGGTRLFRWLAEAGIDETWFRASQYMTAITKCYPGRAKSGSGDRVPSRAEQSLCRPYLEAEIALIDPILILPVGRVAIGLFYPTSLDLDEIIGTEKQVDGRWVVPLPHPSGASRWHQLAENRERVRRAIELIRMHTENTEALKKR